MATSLKPIECSAQPLSISFHPSKDIVAAGLVDGTVEIHDLIAKLSSRGDGVVGVAPAARAKSCDDDDGHDVMVDDEHEEDDEDAETILASIYVAKEVPPSKVNTHMLAKLDDDTATASSKSEPVVGKATQGPSCRWFLFSRSPPENTDTTNTNNNHVQTGGGENHYTN